MSSLERIPDTTRAIPKNFLEGGLELSFADKMGMAGEQEALYNETLMT